MSQTFYSNGKLLLTGEYVVLDGAKALALPTKFGQYFSVVPSAGERISWKSEDHNGEIWFEDTISFDEILKSKNDGSDIKSTLIHILSIAHKMNPNMFQSGHTITTRLTFPKKWGLGTSSTLINNLAQWLKIDAYKLLANTFGGSGYDIACAQHDDAVLYQLLNDNPMVKTVSFHPEFSDCLYFVYLNQKQDSREAIANYRKKDFDLDQTINFIDGLTDEVMTALNIEAFSSALRRHEEYVGKILEMPTLRQRLFPDFAGTVKSLGAWGGDFMMAVSETDPSAYFRAKSYDTIIPYKNMIK